MYLSADLKKCPISVPFGDNLALSLPRLASLIDIKEHNQMRQEKAIPGEGD